MTTAIVSRQAVLAAAENYLTQRQARIAAEREELIAQEMQPPGRLARLFGAKQRTREQAIAKLKAWRPDRLGITDWSEVAISGGAWARRAEALRDLASKATGKYMRLSKDDAWILDHHPTTTGEQR